MSCNNCGCRTEGRLCRQCEIIERNSADHVDDVEPTDASLWECVECGHEFWSVEWIDCPECGSKRRRAAPERCEA